MTEEPSGLQFMWLQRVERDWATNTTLSGTIFKPKWEWRARGLSQFAISQLLDILITHITGK